MRGVLCSARGIRGHNSPGCIGEKSAGSALLIGARSSPAALLRPARQGLARRSQQRRGGACCASMPPYTWPERNGNTCSNEAQPRKRALGNEPPTPHDRTLNRGYNAARKRLALRTTGGERGMGQRRARISREESAFEGGAPARGVHSEKRRRLARLALGEGLPSGLSVRLQDLLRTRMRTRTGRGVVSALLRIASDGAYAKGAGRARLRAGCIAARACVSGQELRARLPCGAARR